MDNKPIDPRRGVPSCSGLRRLERCPGSWLASQGIPDEESEDAAKGTRIHTALETGNFNGLSADEEQTAEMCHAQMQRVVTEWLGNHEDAADQRLHEHRLGLTAYGGVVDVTDAVKLPIRTTGQADLIIIDGKRGLVLDYKTGRGEVRHAADNAQLRGLAVLAAKRWRLESVRVVIVQPWAGKPTVADYDNEALYTANIWLLIVLSEARDATPTDLHAGDWCQYCPARNIPCPALTEKAVQPIETVALSLPADDETARAALFARAMEMSAERLAGLRRGLKIVGWYVSAVEGAARLRAEKDVEFQQYYRLETSPGNREITDAQAAFNALLPLGITAQQALEACSMSLGPIEEAVRIASGIKSQTDKRTVYNITAKDAKAAVNEALEAAGVIKRKADKITLNPVELEITE